MSREPTGKPAVLGEPWHSIQTRLFPILEDELGELDAKHKEFIAVCETCAAHEHMAAYRWVGHDQGTLRR